MAGEIFSCDACSTFLVSHFHQSAVQREFPTVIACGAFAEVYDVHCGERLVELRVMSLHMSLQRVGKAVVLVEECLANLRYPLVCITPFLAVNGTACPQRYVVQVEHIVIGRAIDYGTYLAVSYRVCLLEEFCGAVAPHLHLCLLLC